MSPLAEVISKMEIDDTPTDREVELVVWSMNRFQRGSAERERILQIFFYAVSDGALRNGFPPGCEQKAEAWQRLLSECRRKAM